MDFKYGVYFTIVFLVVTLLLIFCVSYSMVEDEPKGDQQTQLIKYDDSVRKPQSNLRLMHGGEIKDHSDSHEDTSAAPNQQQQQMIRFFSFDEWVKRSPRVRLLRTNKLKTAYHSTRKFLMKFLNSPPSQMNI